MNGLPNLGERLKTYESLCRCETRYGAAEKPLFANTQVSTSRVIHTPSAFARENLLHLQEAGSLRALAPHVSRRENLPGSPLWAPGAPAPENGIFRQIAKSRG